MAGLKSPGPGARKVALYVVGPKRIISKPIKAKTRMSNTWLQFLREELQLNVSADQGMFVCSSGYHPTDPKEGKGWRAEMNDRIFDFVNKYERNRERYRVHICYSSDGNGNDNQGQGQGRNSDSDPLTDAPQKRRTPTPAPTGTQKRTGNSFTGGRTSSERVRSFGRPSSISLPRRPNIVITPNGVQTPQTSSTINGPSPASSSSFQSRRHPPHVSDSPVEAPKRRRLQQQKDQIEEDNQVTIPVGIPSVPGPHVFMMKQEAPARQEPKVCMSLVKAEDPSEMVSAHFHDEEENVETDVDEDGIDDADDGNGGNEWADGENDGRDEEGIVQNVDQDINEPADHQMDDDEENADGDADGLEENQADEELRLLGIPYEDIKSLAERRLSGFSNAYLLRVRSELRNLMANKTWIGLFERSPLSFYLLEQVISK